MRKSRKPLLLMRSYPILIQVSYKCDYLLTSVCCHDDVFQRFSILRSQSPIGHFWFRGTVWRREGMWSLGSRVLALRSVDGRNPESELGSCQYHWCHVRCSLVLRPLVYCIAEGPRRLQSTLNPPVHDHCISF